MSHTLFFIQITILLFTIQRLVVVIKMLKSYEEVIEATRQTLITLREDIRALDSHWRRFRDERIGRY